MSNPGGIYLHIPFCLRKCLYCDFCSYDGIAPEEKERYVAAICREIAAYPVTGQTVTSVYFGGGTPSLLNPSQIGRILDMLARVFMIATDAEITMEINPKTADREKLKQLRSLGINRVSLGMQSLSDRELTALGRVHSAADFFAAVDDVRAAGFPSVSFDLMYGIPFQSEESLAGTLDGMLALSPDHISAYGLIVEEGTPFYRDRAKLPLPDEDGEFAMYRLICRTLAAAGYRHYEISNYAKPGRECSHNLLYWSEREYAAFGLAASSFLDGVRRTNTSNLVAYLADPCHATAECVKIVGTDAEYEYLMLHLRLSDGVDENAFLSRFGHGFAESYRERLAPYFRAGYLLRDGYRTHLTEDGLYISSALLRDLLPG